MINVGTQLIWENFETIVLLKKKKVLIIKGLNLFRAENTDVSLKGKSERSSEGHNSVLWLCLLKDCKEMQIFNRNNSVLRC